MTEVTGNRVVIIDEAKHSTRTRTDAELVQENERIKKQSVEAEDCRAEAALEAGSSASVEPFHLGHGKCASIGPSQGTNQMGTIC